jgi:hypothetical protein
MDCPICLYAKQHACWPPGHRGTHCKDCHVSWTGLARAHCVLCHQTFASNGVAAHHWKRGEHVHPAAVEGYWTDKKGFWHFGPRKQVASDLGLPPRAALGEA